MERYTVESRCNCSSDNKEYKKLFINDDFKINYRFLDHRYSPVKVIPPEYVNCIFTFFIKGREDEEFIASCIDGVTTNCMIDNATNQLKIIFENHGLKSGKLMVKYRFIIRDPEFPTGKADRYGSADTRIILTEDLFEDE